jgi:chromosome segregation ATPase
MTETTLSPSDLDRVEALAKDALPGVSSVKAYRFEKAASPAFTLALIAYVRELEASKGASDDQLEEYRRSMASFQSALDEQTAQCERLTKLLNDSLEYTLAQKSAECERLAADLQNSRNATSNEIYVRVDIERDLAAARAQLSLAHARIASARTAMKALLSSDACGDMAMVLIKPAADWLKDTAALASPDQKEEG